MVFIPESLVILDFLPDGELLVPAWPVPAGTFVAPGTHKLYAAMQKNLS
jgi:hypothetical protein